MDEAAAPAGGSLDATDDVINTPSLELAPAPSQSDVMQNRKRKQRVLEDSD